MPAAKNFDHIAPCIDPQEDSSPDARKKVIEDFFKRAPSASKADAVEFLLKYYPEVSAGGHRGMLQRMYKNNKPWEKPAPVVKVVVTKKIEDTKAEKTTETEERTKTCPKCGVNAVGMDEIDAVFGMRKVKNKQIPQSWCRKCR